MTLPRVEIPREGAIGVWGLYEQLSHSKIPKSCNHLSITLLSYCTVAWTTGYGQSKMLFRLAWFLLCVLPLVALCAEDYYKVIIESPTQLLKQR
jgi:hypothetical protein